MGGEIMANVEKQVIKMGTSAGVYLEKKVLFASGIDIGDKLQIKCSKNKITLIKSENKGDK